MNTEQPGFDEAPADGQEYVRKNRLWVLATSGGSYGEVANFAALPSAAANSGTTYLVRAAQGVLFVNRKPAGLYRSDGATWTRLDEESEAYFQDTLAWGAITSKPSTFPPSGHASSHFPGGGDEIKLDDLAAPDDNTDLDATTAKHGLMPKTDKLKLDGIETSATADQSASEIETAYNTQVAAASQAEAEAGTSTAIRRFTPERVKQAILALAPGGGGGGLTQPQVMARGLGA